MKNIIYFNSNFEPQLLVNEEQTGNSIVIDIITDNTANQTLKITKGETAEPDVSLTSSSENAITLNTDYWNLGGSTTLQLNKNGTLSSIITLNFPDILDTDSSLQGGSSGTYSMQGSSSVNDLIDELLEDVSDLQETTETQSSSISELQTTTESLSENKQNYIDQDILVPTHTGSEGDLIFNANSEDEFKRLYRCENGKWIRVCFLEGGTATPTGGESGDTYIQIKSEVALEYDSSNRIQHVSFAYTDDKITGITMSGTTADGSDWVAYKLSGLVINNSYTVKFTEQFSSNTTFYNKNAVCGIIAYESLAYTSVLDESGLGSIPYAPFNRDTSAHSVSLTFTATKSEMYLIFQLVDVTDGNNITLSITNFSITGQADATGLVALWLNNNGTWLNGVFGGAVEEFEGATSSEDGTSGLVPAPSAGDQSKYLRADGTWATPSGGGGGGTSINILTYTGTGTTNNTITFPSTPTAILCISGTAGGNQGIIFPFLWGTTNIYGQWYGGGFGRLNITASYNGDALTIAGGSASASLNDNGSTYLVLWI